ncbi:N-acetylglucosamine-6-phosphate deacetylase [Clostridium swellfunianum]|uniref:N-acetylglucosamine-6-phosphate deacetylase n=1 Tax=Clostridium swellfunianum TaxID=1367462 RepID=UPI00202EBB27|nr:N-acetylglucosamine-6-phosphate deacetylase [Clostridium swellfunianum]MCM0650988.1 N-acetylglucosamine-6-phosphate deacetylase [Clostridium swellfunianum]
MAQIIVNGNVITPMKIIDNGIVAFEGGKITYVGEKKGYNISENDTVYDAGGNYVSPGFIDIHTHGAGGYDFMDATVEAFLKASETHMKHGTTSIVPTTITSTIKDLYRTLEIFTEAKNKNMGPELIGLHLEGPYFAEEQRGAQDLKYIKNPERKEYLEVLDSSRDIVRWTIAPEKSGALEMGLELRKRGIIPCIGHTNAIYEDIVKAYEHGYSLMTHFYSAMSTVKRIKGVRFAGAVEAGYLIDEMMVEVIADGMHLPKSLLQLIYKIKGSDKICLVTDSMRAAGMPEGEYVLGNTETGQKVIVEDGVAKLKDRTAFAGSVATADRLIRTMRDIAEVPLVECVKMLTLNPAKVMEISSRKGSLVRGKDADIIIFDNFISIKNVWVMGERKI